MEVDGELKGNVLALIVELLTKPVYATRLAPLGASTARWFSTSYTAM
jgi:hypothetical protein